MLYFYLNYSTSIQQILRSVLGSIYPLQKSRINHRCYVWTKALSGRVFAPAQKVSGTLWTWLRQRETKQRLNVDHTFSFICLPSLQMEDKGTNDDLSFFRTSLGPGSAVGKNVKNGVKRHKKNRQAKQAERWTGEGDIWPIWEWDQNLNSCHQDPPPFPPPLPHPIQCWKGLYQGLHAFNPVGGVRRGTGMVHLKSRANIYLACVEKRYSCTIVPRL